MGGKKDKMRLLIIRHGDPDYARDNLTEKGKREAKLLSEMLAKDKIDYLYCSPLGRAKATCAYTAEKLGLKPVIEPWLREFDYRIYIPTGEKEHLIWDMLPGYWTNVPEMYDNGKWLDLPEMKAGNMRYHYETVCRGLDDLLEKHGYRRNGKLDDAVNPNRDTVALFCHFGVESVLLSHLFNIPPMILSHHFVALPSSVTTLFTEERRKGIAVFRCSCFGSTAHLYAGGEEPSFSARFCETFDSDERHD